MQLKAYTLLVNVAPGETKRSQINTKCCKDSVIVNEEILKYRVVKVSLGGSFGPRARGRDSAQGCERVKRCETKTLASPMHPSAKKCK